MSHQADRMVEDEVPIPQRDVGDSIGWLNSGDSAETLAHNANQVNDELRRASGRLEQQVLEFVASMCGKTSLNPASMEFELSAYLATIEEQSLTSDLAEHHLQQAHSFFLCSSMDRACQSLADARSALGHSWEHIFEQNRQPSLPGTSESEASLGYLHDRLVEHFAQELHHCLAANQPTGVQNAIVRLGLLLPCKRIAATYGAALNQVLDGLLKTWNATSASAADDETFIQTAQGIIVDGTGVAIKGFSQCVTQAEWEGVLKWSFAAPIHRFMEAAISKMGLSSVRSLLRMCQSIALATQLASHSEQRELSSAIVTKWLWERSGSWVKGHMTGLVEEGLRDTTQGIPRDSARRNSGGRHGATTRSRGSVGGSSRELGDTHAEAGPWVAVCTRAVSEWRELLPLPGEEPVDGFSAELAREIRVQAAEYVTRAVAELPATLEQQGGVGGVKMLAGLLVLQRGLQNMAGAGDGHGDAVEEWDAASAAVVSAIGEVTVGVVAVVSSGWRDSLFSPIALLPWGANQQILKRDTARATQGLMMWNLALLGWARDTMALLPVDVTARILASLISVSLAALAATYLTAAPSRLNMPQFILDVGYITQVVRSWERGSEVKGKLLSFEGAGSVFVTSIQKLCSGLRAMALLKASPLPALVRILAGIDAVRAEPAREAHSPSGDANGDADLMELGTPAMPRRRGEGGGDARELRKASCLGADGAEQGVDMLEEAYEVGGAKAVFADSVAAMGEEVGREGLGGLAHLRVLLLPDGVVTGAGVQGGRAERGVGMVGWGGDERSWMSIAEIVEPRLDLTGSPFPPLDEEEKAAAVEVAAWCARAKAEWGGR